MHRFKNSVKQLKQNFHMVFSHLMETLTQRGSDELPTQRNRYYN